MLKYKKLTGAFLTAFPDLRIEKREWVNGLSLLVLCIILYGALFLGIGAPFLPQDGPAWAIVFIWFCASVAAQLVDRVHIPGPLGMILAGMALKNIRSGFIITGLRASWSKQLRGAALAIIFLRSGLELDLGIFKRVGPAAIRLLLVPGICEAFFDGGLAVALFGMPITFGFALGFIMKAVGPALVIQCMFEIQQKRLGLAKAIPATVVAAASFDDAIAITGYTIFINIAVSGEGNQVWNILHGPLSVVFGIMAGCVAALLCSCTVLWNNAYKRTLVVFFSALLMKYFFDHFAFTSGGALGSLMLGLVVKETWARGWPHAFAIQAEHGPHLGRSVEKHVRWFWRFVMCPLLFGLIGASLDFANLSNATISKSTAIIFAGLAVRVPITYLVMLRSGFNWKEKLFFGFAWTPKATVQATLAMLPLDAVNSFIPKNSASYANYEAWGEDALVTSIFTILICGSLGTILIRWTAPVLLEKQELPEEEDEGGAGGAVVAERSEDSVLKRSMSGRYKSSDPETPGMTPFGVEARPSAPLAKSGVPSERDLPLESRQLRAQNGLLATYLERFEAIAEEVEGETPTLDLAGSRSEAADKLRTNVRSLRRKLLDDVSPDRPGHEVEGADMFMRASADLRHRTPSFQQALRRQRQREELPTSSGGGTDGGTESSIV